MSNYKWVKTTLGSIELREEDFSPIKKFIASGIDAILMEKLKENGIEVHLDSIDQVLKECSYFLCETEKKTVTITAPLYKYIYNTGKYELELESYTGLANDPEEYKRVQETYSRCVEEVYSEQAKLFEKKFMENSLDNGISSIIVISSNSYQDADAFYEKYVPTEYIKIGYRSVLFSRSREETIFIKDMDAEGKIIWIKIPDEYKGIVIGKGGENINRVAGKINAKKIIVI